MQYNRSSIANVEIGLQHVDRVFWARVDNLLGTEGELLRGYDAIEKATITLVDYATFAVDRRKGGAPWRT